jgi:hypothetical protein
VRVHSGFATQRQLDGRGVMIRSRPVAFALCTVIGTIAPTAAQKITTEDVMKPYDAKTRPDYGPPASSPPARFWRLPGFSRSECRCIGCGQLRFAREPDKRLRLAAELALHARGCSAGVSVRQIASRSLPRAAQIIPRPVPNNAPAGAAARMAAPGLDAPARPLHRGATSALVTYTKPSTIAARTSFAPTGACS